MTDIAPPSQPVIDEPPPFRDEDDFVSEEFLQLATGALIAADVATLKRLVEDLHEVDLADLVEALEPDDRPRFVTLLGPDFDFTALTELDDAVREEILEEIPNETIAAGVAELETDDAVYILEDLAEEDKAEVLAQLPAVDRAALVRSLEFPEDSVGRRMQLDFIAVPSFWNVGQTIDH
jgi:magnesium transporter